MAMLQREWACSGLGATAATEQSHADAGKRLVHSKPLFAGGGNKQNICLLPVCVLRCSFLPPGFQM